MMLPSLEGVVAKAGETTTEEIVKGLSDILRIPANELGLYIADKIRFLRYKSLLKILKKAKEFSSEKGVCLDTPSIKFLIPFAESASLEDEDNEDLQNMWANLLANSGEIDIGDSLLFINFLKNIGQREANFLVEMMESGRATTSAPFISFHNAVDATYLDENSFEVLLERLPVEFDYTYLADIIVDLSECSGVLFSEIALLGEIDGDSAEISTDCNWEIRSRREPAAAILESLGIIQQFDFKRISVERIEGDGELFVKGYRMTQAGIYFYETCTGAKFKHKFDHYVSDNYPEYFGEWLNEHRKTLEAGGV